MTPKNEAQSSINELSPTISKVVEILNLPPETCSTDKAVLDSICYKSEVLTNASFFQIIQASNALRVNYQFNKAFWEENRELYNLATRTLAIWIKGMQSIKEISETTMSKLFNTNDRPSSATSAPANTATIAESPIDHNHPRANCRHHPNLKRATEILGIDIKYVNDEEILGMICDNLHLLAKLKRQQIIDIHNLLIPLAEIKSHEKIALQAIHTLSTWLTATESITRKIRQTMEKDLKDL
ncbi:MAG: hypothetical protein UR28_C0022G0010 [Candidatus Peregrinibacteria bacterium GW2011_GWF2_33_10]|nr:MAG: hypothetical protein UR28_C0022G0010 [Candidatus Peregrinibacteria bacterium GW2011_GWF2_33_10]OGJ44324.1 MAG: hypothetical protein A2263_05545 [Candidatus Peregrinibacteria bacterium RIFOXYA2_FULL_33_21]OGJ46528.1 MAG: hypothetical protein A2272_01415 [Candidatus Peregrinibacteria bacterium RIFOXYA12_FULL_33_12]OGJ50552.1 MAG: hypothetical protein A2307_03190 [Candidatus Peregrinibacteria bacterium RIFOXYB2_FULL_33_20]